MKFLKLLITLSLLIGSFSINAEQQNRVQLKVHLAWFHQSQFAGLYVAQARKFFEQEGLDVVLIEGGPNKDPIKELKLGNVDIAISSLATAWDAYEVNEPITNIAQIFEKSSMALLCRASKGVYTKKDLLGKSIAIYGSSDRRAVIEMLKVIGLKESDVTFTKQSPEAEDLVSGRVACTTVMTHDEYWHAIEKGIPLSDLLLIEPGALGVAVMEDGLYVRASKLDDPKFRDTLVRFMRGARNGWQEAKLAPNLALEAVFQTSPSLNRQHETRSLETVLNMLPKNFQQFGLFDLAKYELQKRYLSDINLAQLDKKIWTHQVWNDLIESDKRDNVIKTSTKYYLGEITTNIYFKLLVYFGVFTYALSGVLEAINRNYDLWGRLILAFLSGVGGGTIRDLIIAGDRIPFYYVKDLNYPLGILLVVVLATLVALINPNVHKTYIFQKVKKYADVFGFSALAVIGASVSIVSGLSWFWAPICAALTCAGGGMLRDVIVNQEPVTFRGVIYEESAILGSVFLLGGLYLAGYFEHSKYIVPAVVIGSFFLIVAMRILIYKYDIHYPKKLGGGTVVGH
jgi:NitT/TauT family transport system substrate-binding protein